MQVITAPSLSAARTLANGFVATGYTLAQERTNGFVLRNGAAILAIKIV